MATYRWVSGLLSFEPHFNSLMYGSSICRGSAVSCHHTQQAKINGIGEESRIYVQCQLFSAKLNATVRSPKALGVAGKLSPINGYEPKRLHCSLTCYIRHSVDTGIIKCRDERKANTKPNPRERAGKSAAPP
jgi:hypothetical protein